MHILILPNRLWRPQDNWPIGDLSREELTPVALDDRLTVNSLWAWLACRQSFFPRSVADHQRTLRFVLLVEGFSAMPEKDEQWHDFAPKSVHGILLPLSLFPSNSEV